jgi:trans-aconitate methyltransferase
MIVGVSMQAYAWNAGDYERYSAAQRQWAAELLQQLKLKPAENVLDIGCGDGKVTAAIAALVPDGSVTGVDLSGAMIVHAQHTYGGVNGSVRFVQADATDLPFWQGFEVVFSNAALHWVKDHAAVLRGIQRALRPGGRYLLQLGGRGNAAGFLNAIEPVIRAPAWHRFFEDFESGYAFYGPDDYEGWLADAGLQASRLELLPKDMQHAGPAGLAGWIRTTWLPYTQRVPTADQETFIEKLVATYLNTHPADRDGTVHVGMVRLEVEGKRP